MTPKLEEIVSGLSEKIKALRKRYNPTYAKYAAVGGAALGVILLAAQLCSDKRPGEERKEVRVVASPAFTSDYTPREPPQRVEPPRPIVSEPALTNYTHPIQQFSNDHVLVYCANQDEKDYAIQTLKQNNNHRRRINVSKNKKTATMHYSGNSTINFNIVVSGEKIPQVRGGYDIITLRGHVWDMEPLYSTLNNFGAPNTALLLGGCYSDQFIRQMAAPNRAVFSSKVKAYGSMNTYMLLKIIENLPQANNWNDLERRIENQSERARTEYVFPESKEYLDYVSLKERNKL